MEYTSTTRDIISIHAPRAGCDLTVLQAAVKAVQFQSTHPVRGATWPGSCKGAVQSYFNPRTPCGVRQLRYKTQTLQSYFNPRTPCGVRPIGGGVVALSVAISIHAPRAGCDAPGSLSHFLAPDFNPRTPCGVRRHCDAVRRAAQYFNPRTPCGVRRCRTKPVAAPETISIHAPRAGCDINSSPNIGQTVNFNPRTPCGVRLNNKRRTLQC